MSDVTGREQTELLLREQNRLLEMIATGVPLDACLSSLCAAVPRLGPHARASILLADEARKTFPRSIAPDLLPSWGEGLKDAPINDLLVGTCGTAAYTGKPVICSDIGNDDRWSKEWRELCLANSILACHSAPIPGDGGPLGSFMLCFDKARAPNESDERLSDFGTHVASIAIERDRAKERLRESKAQLEAELANAKLLRNISAQLIYQDDVDALYEEILDAAVDLMRSDFASMQMLYPERGSGGELRLLAFRGFSPEAATFWEWVDADSDGTCGAALRTGERVIVPDVEACEAMADTEDLAMFRQTGIRAAQTTPLISRGGQILGMISTHWLQPHQPSRRDLRLLDILARQAADLIERKRAEERERRIHEETRAARAAAEKANQAKSRFLATMSHELRTPLNAIIGYGDLLDAGIGGSLSDTQRQHLGRIDASARHLLQFIEEILTFSRIEVGREDVGIESTDIAELVRETAALVRPLAQHEELNLETRVSDELGTIETDAGKVRQILLNLLSNAIKFTDAGTIRVEAHSESGDSVLLRVSDTGIGIAPEQQERIFESFSQVERLAIGQADGTGLGLSVTRQLVRLLGGTIELESAVGEGSTFTVRLPLRVEAHASAG